MSNLNKTEETIENEKQQQTIDLYIQIFKEKFNYFDILKEIEEICCWFNKYCESQILIAINEIIENQNIKNEDKLKEAIANHDCSNKIIFNLQQIYLTNFHHSNYILLSETIQLINTILMSTKLKFKFENFKYLIYCVAHYYKQQHNFSLIGVSNNIQLIQQVYNEIKPSEEGKVQK